MSSMIDRLVWRVYSLAKSVVKTTGLQHSRVGRKILAALNVMGSFGTRIFLRSERRASFIDGHRMFLADLRNPSLSFSANMLVGQYEQGTKRLFENMIRKGMVVLDIGAHVGYYTLHAARLVGPEGKVYAFEPEPENYTILQKNVALNAYGNISLVQKAVVGRAGTAKLFLSRQGNDRHSLFVNPRSLLPEPSTEVAAISLDDFLAAEGWPHVDLIKMDIEGAEPLALQGMRQLISRSADLKLIVEFAPESLQAAGFVPSEFLERLAALGFTLKSVEDDGSLRPLEHADFPSFARELEGQGVRNLICEKKAPGRQNADVDGTAVVLLPVTTGKSS